jgi:trehalose utilization protein
MTFRKPTGESMPIRVTIWNENLHERKNGAASVHYPRGIHEAIAEGLRGDLGDDAVIGTATLDQPRHGLTAEVLEGTDVLLWWGHARHHLVADEVVDDVCARVRAGMGLIALHSAQGSKVFKRLMGTSCQVNWRHGEREVLWTVDPGHPIARGVPHPVVIEEQEMYGEFFAIPAPEELVFISSFSGGEVFRSGCCFRRGLGRIFYFSPGHEEYPVYYQKEIRTILANAVRWANPGGAAPVPATGHKPKGWYETHEETVP